MKTVQDWEVVYWSNDSIEFEDIVKQIQDDAWNSAIYAAVREAIVGCRDEEKDCSYPIGNNVQINDVDVLCVHNESVLKLLK